MKASQMFEKSNLKGKQIWYFTAPASVPISSIESMSLLDVKAGEPVLKHKNDDYGFMQDSAEDKTYTKIMVPSSSDNGYKTCRSPHHMSRPDRFPAKHDKASREIDQIMHLQHIVKLPGVHEGVDSNSSSASKATIPTIKSARPQPKGLKMRFRPLGFGSGEPGTIGSEDSQVRKYFLHYLRSMGFWLSKEFGRHACKVDLAQLLQQFSSRLNALEISKQPNNDGITYRNSLLTGSSGFG